MTDAIPTIEANQTVSDTVTNAGWNDRETVERAIRGAIRTGYDGVDINRSTEPLFELGSVDPVDSVSVGIASIEPWHRPAPDGANGYRTERYVWDWFSEDDLTALLRTDDPIEVPRNDG